MGGSKSKFIINFSVETQKYFNIATYIFESGIFKEKSEGLRILVNEYNALIAQHISKEKNPAESQALKDIRARLDLSAIWSIHKIQTESYFAGLLMQVEDLMDCCVRQNIFFQKIVETRDTFNEKKWFNEYMVFLNLCKKYPKEPIVPNFHQDFMWHVHIQDTHAYTIDTLVMFGKLIHHDDNIDEITLRKNRIITESYSEGVNYLRRNDGSCARKLTKDGNIKGKK